MAEEREESRIQWHPAFYAATKLELRDNIDELEFYPEYNLSKKPLQADLLIIEKNSDVQIKNAIGHIFRKRDIGLCDAGREGGCTGSAEGKWNS